MNRIDILEAMYETIKNSIEWGIGEKDYEYFIDGVVAVTETMLDKVKIEEEIKENRLKELDAKILERESKYADAGRIAATIAEIKELPNAEALHKEALATSYDYAGRA